MAKGKQQQGVVLCFVTAPSEAVARQLARTVVEERLAACAPVVPGMTSVYRWDGKVNEEPEALILCKTRGEGFERLTKRIVELHPYEVPQVVAVPIEAGYGAYMQWVDENVD